MFALNNQLELRKVTVSSLITCIYLPIIVTVVSYKGLLYSVGHGSSFYILVLIFFAEFLKSVYLTSSNDTQNKKRASKNRVHELLWSIGVMFTMMGSFFIAIVLFGAPVLDNHEETLMLSALMTLLTVFPLIAHSGSEAAFQHVFGVRNYSKNTVVAMLVNNSLLTVCGAWLGAVVIPLDWNTPWQVWPIPCYLGALGGYLFANVLNVVKVTLMSAAQKYPSVNFLVNIIDQLPSSK